MAKKFMVCIKCGCLKGRSHTTGCDGNQGWRELTIPPQRSR